MKQLISNDNFIAIKISYIFHFLCIYKHIYLSNNIIIYLFGTALPSETKTLYDAI